MNYYPVIYRDDFMPALIRIPINQPGFNGPLRSKWAIGFDCSRSDLQVRKICFVEICCFFC